MCARSTLSAVPRSRIRSRQGRKHAVKEHRVRRGNVHSLFYAASRTRVCMRFTVLVSARSAFCFPLWLLCSLGSPAPWRLCLFRVHGKRSDGLSTPTTSTACGREGGREGEMAPPPPPAASPSFLFGVYSSLLAIDAFFLSYFILFLSLPFFFCSVSFYVAVVFEFHGRMCVCASTGCVSGPSPNE